MASNFDRALAFVLHWEGGETDDPRDAGGHTNLGISERAHPGEDISAMTRERAAEIYRRSYWDPCRCDELPWPVALGLFDLAVNAGPRTAIKCLQRALGVTVDADFGPATMAAGHGSDPAIVARNLAAERIIFYAGLHDWPIYGRGWVRRAVAAASA